VLSVLLAIIVRKVNNLNSNKMSQRNTALLDTKAKSESDCF